MIVMKEYNPNINLSDWNNLQKVLWMKLVNFKIVSRNDTIKFFLFAKFFDTFYKENNSIPSMSDVIEFMTGIL